MLADANHGIDWAGLPLAVEYLGVRDVEALIDRLLVIRAYALRPDPPSAEKHEG